MHPCRLYNCVTNHAATQALREDVLVYDDTSTPIKLQRLLCTHCVQIDGTQALSTGLLVVLQLQAAHPSFLSVLDPGILIRPFRYQDFEELPAWMWGGFSWQFSLQYSMARLGASAKSGQ